MLQKRIDVQACLDFTLITRKKLIAIKMKRKQNKLG